MQRGFRVATVLCLSALALTGCSVPPVLFVKVDARGHLELSYCDGALFDGMTISLESMRIVEEPTWTWAGELRRFAENEIIDPAALDGEWLPAVPVLDDDREWEYLYVEADGIDGSGFSSRFKYSDLEEGEWVASSTSFAPACPNQP